MARAIGRVLKRHRLTSTVGLMARMETDSALAEELVAEMTVGETRFFRDPRQLEWVGDHILPALLERRPPGSPVKIWGAGCSTGEEAYSLAVMAHELGLLSQVRIIATDISRRAVDTAAGGRYGVRSFRGDAAARMKPYADRAGRYLRVNDGLRRSVHFDCFALGIDVLPAAQKGIVDLDLILCRNVFIYLQPRIVRRVALQFYHSLADGGWLVLGPSDPPLWEHAPFVTYRTTTGVFYRKEAYALRRHGDRVFKDHHEPERADAIKAERPPEVDWVGSKLGDRLRRASLTQGESPLAHRVNSMLRAGELQAAGALAADGVIRYPVSIKLHYLHGLILIAKDRREEAQSVVRRLIYLDGRLPAAQFLLGTCLRHSDPQAALKAFETALALCANHPPEQPVDSLTRGHAGQLATRIKREIAGLMRHRKADT